MGGGLRALHRGEGAAPTGVMVLQALASPGPCFHSCEKCFIIFVMNIAPQQQAQIADICRRYGVRRMQMFGSAAQGQEQLGSDVDLLVEFMPDQYPTGFALVDMQDELSTVFDGRAIDLAFPSVLNNPFRRKAIEPQLRLLYQ